MTPLELAALFDAHARALTLYARGFLADPQQAADVVQEAFLRLMSQAKAPKSVRAWLYVCVRNEALTLRRSLRRRQARHEAVATMTPEWFERDFASGLDARAAREALQELTPEDREVVVLRIWGDLTLREISEITRRPVSSVFHVYRQALAEIRQRMGIHESNRQP